MEKYLINICNSLTMPSDCNGSSICMTSTGTSVSYGDFDKHPQIQTASSTSISFYFEYNTTKLCLSNGHEKYYYRSSITFECGKVLGSPVVISSDRCSVDILWETSRACIDAPRTDATKEVRCYAYDSTGHKRDLEDLILQNGAHYVKDPSSTLSEPDGVYINVCRDIQSNSVHNCPVGSAACLVKNGHSYSLGEPTSAVNITKQNRLVLEYLSADGSKAPPECSNTPPKVLITFVCPDKRRGGSKLPIVTSSMNCQYDIEWWTEAACVADSITSSTCGLSAPIHGIDLDLTPLTNHQNPYQFDTHDTSDTKFFLNVCAATGISCGKITATDSAAHNAVCQTTKSKPHGYIAGDVDNYKLKYIDDQLSLIYMGGERCSNGIRRSSVIFFHCNHTAGKGTPVFNHEWHCTYFFDWSTSYACVNMASSTCQFTDNAGQVYDLSSLTKIPGSDENNWQGINGESHSNKEIFINICGEVLQSEGASSCPAGSSVCEIDRGSSTVPTSSFGTSTNSSLYRQNGKLILEYDGGSSCADGRHRSTRITFYCRLGDLKSSPVITYESSDHCELAVMWHTAAACPLKSVTGSDCRISDDTSGLTFDLGKLTKPGNQTYQVNMGQYDYYLNICDDVSNTPCNIGSRHVAVCQVELHGSKNHYVLGETSTKLLYYNGFVKLAYHNGDPYRDHLHNRTAQVSFLCDTKAGAGHPQFMKERNHTYLFDWYTSYVCPVASTQCMVTDGKGNQYDLSSLAKSEDDHTANWVAVEENVSGQKRRKYYINVCRPVNEVRDSSNHDLGCDALAGACESTISTSGQEHVSVASLGRISTGPQIEKEGRLLLTYVNGSSCNEAGKTKQFTTRIHFVCQRGASASSPRLLERTSCSVSFEWKTEAACAITQNVATTNASTCEIKDQNSENIFNLEPLKKKPDSPYVISDGTGAHDYQINICGSVSSCQDGQHSNIAGCRVATFPKNIDDRVDNNPLLSYSTGGFVTLRYNTLERDPVTNNFLAYEITFVCNRTMSTGQLKYNTRTTDLVSFNFLTPLVCQPQAVACTVTDEHGFQYDLSPLSRVTQPWSYIDPQTSRHYYISVCQPLSRISGCQGAASGACYTEGSGSQPVKGYNLGLIQSNLEAKSHNGVDASVSIHYQSGDICDVDKNRRYSTFILLQCSDVGGAPVLQKHSDPCQFYFVWQTPAACPVKISHSSPDQSCAVTDPLYHITYDLSSMAAATDYKVTTGGEWDFSLNICSKLKHSSGKCANSASCQVSHASPAERIHDAGKVNTTLVYEDGVILLTYLHGQPCHNNRFERSTVLRFLCDHSDNLGASFINETVDCTYMFDWPTPHACPPYKAIGCVAQDSAGKQYDLTSLSLTNNNHMVATRGDTSGNIYYLNVCRSMLHRDHVTCPPNSAACFKTSSNKYYNLGEVTGNPRFVDKKLQITYTNGDPCSSDKSRKYLTTITFECDSSSASNTPPVLTVGEESCHVQILWSTKAACPLGEHSTSKPSTESPCTATNPATNHLFNLTSLASSTYYTLRSDTGHTFNINVCKKSVDANCQNSGNCITYNGKHYSGGSVSDQLSYNEGALSLRYEHGAQCEANKQYTHSSVISFVCHRSTSSVLHHPSAPASTPIYVDDDANTCTHYFSWHTHLACELQSPCQVINSSSTVPHIIDMSPLISESGHFTAVSDLAGKKASYFINVCRPLEPIHGVTCLPGSAACEVAADHVIKSLGYVDPSDDNMLTYDKISNAVVLHYKSSTPCATNSSAKVSTRIVFSCMVGADKDNSSPRLLTVTSDCVYLFIWETDLLCPSLPPSHNTSSSSTTDCTYKDPKTGDVYDLTKLQPIQITDGADTFKVSPCQPLSSDDACKDAAACFTPAGGAKMSLGQASTRRVSFDVTTGFPAQMKFTGGAACNNPANHKREISILFQCDRNMHSSANNKPSITYDHNDQCQYTVYWPTPHVCPTPSERCVAVDSDSGTTYDLSLLSSLTHTWNFKDGDGNTYFINICRPERNDNAGSCKEGTTVCKVTKGNKQLQSLGVLRSQVMAATSPSTVTLRYSGGDQGVCEDREMLASTIIIFICDHSTTGAPRFDRLSQNDCVLHVTWKSSIACAVKPQSVELDNSGKFVDPESKSTIDLTNLLQKTWIARGDIRRDKLGVSTYEYAISLRGQLDTSKLAQTAQQHCPGTSAVCQYKVNGQFARKIAETSPHPPTYIMADESLEISFTSTDQCHKDSTKFSHVVISLRCSRYSGLGQPTFIYESNECGYFFEWYTNVMCVELSSQTLPPKISLNSSSSNVAVNKDSHEAVGRHDQTAVVLIMLFVSFILVGGIVFILRKPERRIRLKRALCSSCTGQSRGNYRYIRSGNSHDQEGTSLFDDEDDILMHEETSLLGTRNFNSPSGEGVASDNDDLFEIPDVSTRGSSKKNKPNKESAQRKGARAKAKSMRPSELSDDSDDLLSFVKIDKKDRIPGVGGEKIESYHDDDDDDLLNA